MDPRKQAIKALEEAGYEFYEHGSGHDKFKHPVTHKVIPLMRHKVNENTLRYIKQEIRRNKK